MKDIVREALRGQRTSRSQAEPCPSRSTTRAQRQALHCCKERGHRLPHRSEDHYTWHGEGQTAMTPLDDEGEPMKDAIRERWEPDYCGRTYVTQDDLTLACTRKSGHSRGAL